MTISPKGFLSPDANNRPRMTAAQAREVAKAVRAAIDCEVDGETLEPDLATVAKRIATDAVAGYPQDRSCVTCDFLASDEPFCLHYQVTVPAEHIEAGCDEHRDEDCPF